MGVERSFAGPLRVSDLLAMEMAEGNVPTTEELIDVALGWTGAGPAAITRPELFSFFERSLAPALERAGRGQRFIEAVKWVLEKLPERLYRPVTDIALPSNFKTKFLSYFNAPTDLAEAYLRWLCAPTRRGASFRSPVGNQPYLIALNPDRMRSMTPVHEMMHYYAAPEIFPTNVRKVLEETYKDLTLGQLLQLEGITGVDLSTPYEIVAELGANYLVGPKSVWLGAIKELPTPYQSWLRSILTRLGENI